VPATPSVTVLPRRVVLIAVAVVLVLAGALGLHRGAVANAAVIDGAITSVSVEQTQASAHESMRVNVDWAVPDSARSGDTFTLQLPQELQAVSRSFKLLAPDGTVVATAVENNGVVTFTLTSYADTHSAITGTAFFTVRWDLDHVTTQGPIPLSFTAGTKVFHDSVSFIAGGNDSRARPMKFGNWTDPVAKDSVSGVDALTWSIDSSGGPFTTMTVKDDVSAGQAFDCGTLKFQIADSFDANGTLIGLHKLPAGQVLSQSCSTSELLVSAGPALNGQVIRVSIKSSVTDASLAEYTNSAAVTIDGRTYHSVSGKVERDNAGGNGSGATASATTTTTTSSPSTTGTATVSATTTSTTSTSTTSTSSTTTGGATVLPTELTSSRAPSTEAETATLPFTGANVAPLLAMAALLLGGGLLLLLAGRRGSQGRRH
jgi:hypothetical protein